MFGIFNNPEQTLCADDLLRPLVEYEVLELRLFKGLYVLIHKGCNAVFLGFTLVVMMVVMVMMTVLVFLVLVVVVMMFVVVFMLVMVVMMLMLLMLVEILGVFTFHLHRLDPAGALDNLSVVKVVGREDLCHVHIAVGRLNDLCVGLQRFYYRQHVGFFLLGYIIDLVENDGCAVFDLLDQQVLNIFLVEIVLQKRSAGAEFIRQTVRVHNGGDAVQIGDSRQSCLWIGAVEHADGACDRTRLADTGSFDQNIIKLARLCQLDDLLHQIDLECAADAAVLQRNKILVLLCDRAALCNQGSVNIDLADVVDDDRHLVALLVGEHMVEYGRLSCAQITGQQRNRHQLILFLKHFDHLVRFFIPYHNAKFGILQAYPEKHVDKYPVGVYNQAIKYPIGV